MLGWWRKTRDAGAAEGLYARLVGEARQPAWYRSAGIADTMDGRFAVLASLLSLLMLRLDRAGEAGVRMGVTLTEAFIADMDIQMREAGFGDPSLGKQVRQLVGALAARVDRLRGAAPGSDGWDDAVRFALYRDEPVGDAHWQAGRALLAAFAARLDDGANRAILSGDW